MKIGIVGKGFVGSAVKFGFSPNTGVDYEVKIYDKDPLKSTHTLKDTVCESDIIFISVPTPANHEGKISLKVLDDCLKEINDCLSKESEKNIFLIRSTVIPGTCDSFSKKYPRLRIVFNPEFLTERSANFDFINQSRIILGGKAEDTDKVSKLYKARFGNSIPIIETDYRSSELIKYMCNNYFATKVSFLNEMKLISDKIGANWEDCMDGFIRDGRIGHSHMQVPGPDGKPGFGGSCFPKDIQAMISFSEDLGIQTNVLKGAWNTNLKLRPEKDWEQLKGRAIEDE